MANDFQNQLTEDLDCFINPDEFAIEAEYHGVKEGITKNLNGLWDTPFSTTNPETSEVVQSTQPSFRVKEHELPGIPPRVRPGDFIIINSKEYWVKESQPDGVGTVNLEVKVK